MTPITYHVTNVTKPERGGDHFDSVEAVSGFVRAYVTEHGKDAAIRDLVVQETRDGSTTGRPLDLSPFLDETDE